MTAKLTLIEHPILQHKLTILRDKNTDSSLFRQTMGEMSRLVAYEATRNLELEDVRIETPLEHTNSKIVSQKMTIVSIMRSGNGMLDSLLQLLPFAAAGHIGIYRDKFIKNTVEYYFRLPDNIEGQHVLLADPLLATGDTAVASIDRLKQYKVGKISMLCLLVSQPGVEKLHQFHPDVEVFAVARERDLNANGYLLPGIGDAGDRMYHTKTE